jgi:hypothetical protein
MNKKTDALAVLDEALTLHPGYEHALNLKSLIGQEQKNPTVQIEARYVGCFVDSVRMLTVRSDQKNIAKAWSAS